MDCLVENLRLKRIKSTVSELFSGKFEIKQNKKTCKTRP